MVVPLPLPLLLDLSHFFWKFFCVFWLLLLLMEFSFELLFFQPFFRVVKKIFFFYFSENNVFATLCFFADDVVGCAGATGESGNSWFGVVPIMLVACTSSG